MRKTIIVCLVFTMILCSSCQMAEKEIKEAQPQVSQMKAICELAADCYYHNVAKYKAEDAEGILLWKKTGIFG